MLRRFRLLPLLLAFLLVFSVVPPSHAAEATDDPLTSEEAIQLLRNYSIVQGDQTGSLSLDAQLTRAQAAAIFVRAMNMSSFAASMANSVTYSDAKGHWGAGEIAMASQLGLMKGDPNGLFRPDDQITYAEVLTVLLRMIDQEPTGAWDSAVIMWRALEVGIAPQGVSATAPAVRQQTFWALASAMTVPVGNGKSLLGRNFDVVPPTLVMGDLESPTAAESMTIDGVSTGSIRVLVGGKAATLDKRTGEFSAKVDLSMGMNLFQVESFDRAGNRATADLSIERRPKVSKILIEGPEMIAPNSSVKLDIKAVDDKGKAVEMADATYTLSNKNHSFNQSAMTLKTGSQQGTATLTVTMGSVKGTYTFEVQGLSDKVEGLRIEPINEGLAPAPDKEYTVTVVVVDEDGNVVTEDYGREIELEADSDDINISPAKAKTVDGKATFTLEGDDDGTYELVASSKGLDDAEEIIEVLESPRIVLKSSKDVLTADGESETRITAVLMDDRGREIDNDDDDIEIALRVRSSDGTFEDDENILIIEEDESSSNRVTFIAGYDEETVEIVGDVESYHDYPVQTLEIPIEESELAGVEFELDWERDDDDDDLVTVWLRVRDEDGDTAEDGSYSFQIDLTAYEGSSVVDEDSDGLPEGVIFEFEDGEDGPLDDSDIVGRTDDGIAIMQLEVTDFAITKVRIETVGVSATDDAYNPDRGEGSGASSRDLDDDSVTVSFD